MLRLAPSTVLLSVVILPNAPKDLQAQRFERLPVLRRSDLFVFEVQRQCPRPSEVSRQVGAMGTGYQGWSIVCGWSTSMSGPPSLRVGHCAGALVAHRAERCC